MLILVSDGVSADLHSGRDAEVARLLKKDGIMVYGVHIGGSDVPDAIVNITSLTGGGVFVPGDPEGLRQVFQTIDAMQQTRVEKMAAETVDDYGDFSTLALGLVGASLLAMFGLRYTPW